MIKKLIILGATLAVLTPIFAYIRNVSWGESLPAGEAGSLIAGIFPIFGLLAFTLLWLHSISGVFEEWLRTQFDPPRLAEASRGEAGFDAFVHWTALVILVSIILHPLLLLVVIRFNLELILSSLHLPIWFGIIGLTLLLTYDIGKILKKKYNFFARHWTKVLIVSNIGFILTFFHSLLIGSLLQSGFMRGLWIFYGVSAICALIYTYAIKPFLKQKPHTSAG